MTTALIKSEPKQLALTDRPAPSVADMLQAVIEKGVTAENVAAVGEIVKLYERTQDRDAEKAFASAFISLQSEIPKIQATKIIPDKNGRMRSSFAPFEEIDAQVRPLCLKHGFTYTFSQGDLEPGRITKICTLQHVGGHKRSNPYSVRVGQGPPGCSEAQSDGSAHSYAKRGALCDALTIVVVGIDDDARIEGGPISKEQADELARRVQLTESNRDAFLKLAGAASFPEIKSSKYEMLDEMLKRKEQKGR